MMDHIIDSKIDSASASKKKLKYTYKYNIMPVRAEITCIIKAFAT